ncbi:hypothetical protein B296_00013247 [Ensete ventricosum]|uniref:PUB domain-containing protein n=1 Tax=Ensete ventricosum TaxID=4639 RepID=A0A426ZYA2_ENSVE|nr:hypothetical protein B296_00013247 [Ensete ventricosum]
MVLKPAWTENVLIRRKKKKKEKWKEKRKRREYVLVKTSWKPNVLRRKMKEKGSSQSNFCFNCNLLFCRILALRKAEKEEEKRAREKIRQKLEEDKVLEDEDAKVKRAFQTLLTYVGNVAKNPNEEKFRKIRLNNPTFQVMDKIKRHVFFVSWIE